MRSFRCSGHPASFGSHDRSAGLARDPRPPGVERRSFRKGGGEDLPRVREATKPVADLQRVRGDAGPVPERRRLLEDGVDDDADGGVGERPAEPRERVDEKVALRAWDGLSTDVAKPTLDVAWAKRGRARRSQIARSVPRRQCRSVIRSSSVPLLASGETVRQKRALSDL
jgi:hypothetical protein